MGNPPYNAVQVSFNDANPADKYPDIDKKIEENWGETNVKKRSTQYDMYKRFLRWSTDRIKNHGMVVFISNNSFLDAKSDDGFRRSVYEEFDYIYIVNLKGNQNIQTWRREGGKIFGIRAKIGISIYFLIKTGEEKSQIHYTEVEDYTSRENKLKWLADNSLSTLSLRTIVPNENAIWLNQTDNDFDELVPVANEENSLFGLLTMGSASAKDDWVYDFDKKELENKIRYFATFYNNQISTYANTAKSTTEIGKEIDKKIKWTEDTIRHLKRGNKIKYSRIRVMPTLYRPFVLKHQYFDKIITHRQRKFPDLFRDDNSNMLICFVNPQSSATFQTLAANQIVEDHLVATTQCIPLYTHYNDKPHSNVTEFGLKLFRDYYKNNNITDHDIFCYVYAIFNDPKYLEKYKFNLQRKFPRIPLAKDFDKWVEIGKKLYDLHVGFESTKPYPLKRTDKKVKCGRTKLKLKKPKTPDELPTIIIDDQTTLEGLPNAVLQYKFSSRCALEWILEFYKESKNIISDKSCDDPKICEKFNTYKFEDYKEHVIDLLQRVTTVSVETIKLKKELEKMPWGEQLKLDLVKYYKDEKKRQQTKSKKIKKSKKPRKTNEKSKRSRKSRKSIDGTIQKKIF